MKDWKHPQRRKQIWKSQITSFFICDQDVPKMLVSDVLYVPKSHIIFSPLCLLGWGIKKKNKPTTEMWQSLILFHHRGCNNWDCCILNNIKILRMKVVMVELWCHSSRWKCRLGEALRDTSTIFPFGHMREGSWWPEFSESRIRNERRRKQEQLSPQQSNVDGKHPFGSRKEAQHFFSC